MFNFTISPVLVKKTLTRSVLLIAGGLTVTGLLLGSAPSLSGKIPYLILGIPAIAQEFNQDQVMKYARVFLEIEELRQNAHTEIKRIMNSTTVPDIACHRRESLQGLSREARQVVVEFCNRSKELVQSSGLTVAEFNQITQRAQNDDDFLRRVQEAMVNTNNQNKFAGYE